MERALTATDLGKTYGDGVWTLDGATFEVGYGEIFACLGRDGSAKTTTVRILIDNPVEPYRRNSRETERP
jgi:ABC-type multidrug transport system ATPase subunit